MIALDEVISKMQEIINHLAENKISQIDDGDYVANLIVKLASYNATLGQYVADLDRDADLAEAHYEMKRETAYRDARLGEDDSNKKTTVADADNAKRLESAEEKEVAIQMKHQYRVASILRADAANLIDALRSKLSYMKQERNNS